MPHVGTVTYKYHYPVAAAVLYDALTDDSFYSTLESAVSSNEAAAKQAMLRYLDYSMIEAQEYGLLRFPADPSSGAAIWSKPLATEVRAAVGARKKAFISEHMSDRCLYVYTRITEFMRSRTMTVVDPENWYLSIIGIAPTRQNCGVGFDLMRNVLQETDQIGVASFLETFVPRNKSFYARLGYRECAVFREPTTGADYAVMQRDPRGPS
jgi:GNAT superfamily N-acetyltransferase